MVIARNQGQKIADWSSVSRSKRLSSSIESYNAGFGGKISTDTSKAGITKRTSTPQEVPKLGAAKG